MQSIAVIGKQNNPLYISNSTLKYDFISHCCIDIIEKSERKEAYLGLLCCLEDSTCFGYLTNTGIKIILMMETKDVQMRDTMVLKVFAKVHDLFINHSLNPFYEPGTMIVCQKFKSNIDEIVKAGFH
jgi:trafficking protein particle complex subunit 2